MTNQIGRVLLLASLLYCCRQVQHTYQPPESETVEDAKAIFLSFSISADSSGKNVIELISKKVTDGAVKGKPSATISTSYLIVSLLDKSGGVKVEEMVEHPLLREVEYTNEKNELAHKALNLKNAEFFVRLKLPSSADHVLVTEVVNQKKINSAEFPLR